MKILDVLRQKPTTDEKGNPILDKDGKRVKWISGSAWNSKGEKTDVVVGYKRVDGRWIGFTIDTKDRFLGFEEGHHGIIMKPIEKAFNELGDTGIDVPSGSFIVAEVTKISDAGKGKGYDYDFKPVLYQKTGKSWDMQYKVYIWFGVYEIRNVDARLFFHFYTKG